MYLPERDQVSYSRQKLESLLSSIYGGRVAEELVFGHEKVTTGASNDIQKATEIAHNMVTKWGLSERLGPLMYGQDNEQPFLGHSMGMKKNDSIADSTAEAIDQEVRALIERNYARTVKLLSENVDILHAMAEILIKYETIDTAQVEQLMNRQTVTPPDGYLEPSSSPLPPADNKTS